MYGCERLSKKALLARLVAFKERGWIDSDSPVVVSRDSGHITLRLGSWSTVCIGHNRLWAEDLLSLQNKLRGE